MWSGVVQGHEGRGHLPIDKASELPQQVADVDVAGSGVDGVAHPVVRVAVACPALSTAELFTVDEQAAPLRCGTESQQVRRRLCPRQWWGVPRNSWRAWAFARAGGVDCTASDPRRAAEGSCGR